MSGPILTRLDPYGDFAHIKPESLEEAARLMNHANRELELFKAEKLSTQTRLLREESRLTTQLAEAKHRLDISVEAWGLGSKVQ